MMMMMMIFPQLFILHALQRVTAEATRNVYLMGPTKHAPANPDLPSEAVVNAKVRVFLYL